MYSQYVYGIIGAASVGICAFFAGVVVDGRGRVTRLPPSKNTNGVVTVHSISSHTTNRRASATSASCVTVKGERVVAGFDEHRL